MSQRWWGPVAPTNGMEYADQPYAPRSLPMNGASFGRIARPLSVGIESMGGGAPTAEAIGTPYRGLGKTNVGLPVPQPSQLPRDEVTGKLELGPVAPRYGMFEGMLKGLAGIMFGFLPEDMREGVTQLAGTVGQVPDIVAENVGHVPLPWVPDVKQAFRKLEPTPEWEQINSYAVTNPSEAMHYMAEYVRAHENEYIEAIGVNPAFAPFFLPDTNILERVLAIPGLPQAAIARTYAGLDMRDFEGTVLNADPASLPAPLQELQARWKTGEMTRDEVLDELTRIGFAFTNDIGMNLLLSVMSDPLIVGGLGSGLAYRAVQTGGLAARTASALNRFRLTGEAGAAAEASARTTVIERQVAALRARNPGLSDEVLRLKATKSDTRLNELVFEELRRMDAPAADRALAEAHAGLSRVQRAEVNAAPFLEKVSIIARASNDIFSAFGRDRVATAFGALRTDRHVRAAALVYGHGTVNRISQLATLHGDISRLTESIGTWLSNSEASLIHGRNLTRNVLASGLPEGITEAAPIQRIRETSYISPDRLTVESEAQLYKVKPDFVPDLQGVPEGEQKAARAAWRAGLEEKAARQLAYAAGVPYEIALKELRGANDDVLGWIEGANFGRAVRDLKSGIADAGPRVGGLITNIKGRKRISKKAQKELDKLEAQGAQLPRYTLVGLRELTVARAAELLRKAQSGSPSALADLRAAVRQYDILRDNFEMVRDDDIFLTNITTYLEDALAKGVDESPLVSTIKKVNLPEELQRVVERSGYEVGLAPTAENQWRITKDLEGHIVAASPWIDLVDDVSPNYAPTRLDTVRAKLFHPIRGEKLLREAKRAFHIDSERSYGLTKRESDKLFFAVRQAGERIGVQSRGLTLDDFQGIIDGMLIDEAVRQKLGADGLALLTARAFEGDAMTVGLTAKVTGKMKTTSAGWGNWVGIVSERIYPMVRFSANPIFQIQELVEPFFFNIIRGVKPGMRWTQEDRQTLAMLDRWGLGARFSDMAEYNYLTHQGWLATTTKPGTFGKDGAIAAQNTRIGIRSVKERKMLNYVREVRAEGGKNFKEAVMSTSPQTWAELTAHYGTTNADEIARRYWIDKGIFHPDDPDYATFHAGAVTPSDLGQPTRLDLKTAARHFSYSDVNAMRRAIREGSFQETRFRSDAAVSSWTPEYADRMWRTLAFSSPEKFWDDWAANLRKAGNTREAAKRSADQLSKLARAAAARAGISHDEWLATRFSRSSVFLDSSRDLPAHAFRQMGVETIMHMATARPDLNVRVIVDGMPEFDEARAAANSLMPVPTPERLKEAARTQTPPVALRGQVQVLEDGTWVNRGDPFDSLEDAHAKADQWRGQGQMAQVRNVYEPQGPGRPTTNARYVTSGLNGDILVGQHDPRQLLDWAESVLTPDQIENASMWYEDLVTLYSGLASALRPEEMRVLNEAMDAVGLPRIGAGAAEVGGTFGTRPPEMLEVPKVVRDDRMKAINARLSTIDDVDVLGPNDWVPTESSFTYYHQQWADFENEQRVARGLDRAGGSVKGEPNTGVILPGVGYGNRRTVVYLGDDGTPVASVDIELASTSPPITINDIRPPAPPGTLVLSGRPHIAQVQVRASERQTGKGYGHQLYDWIQDNTNIDLYEIVGDPQLSSFTPPGRRFAEKWLRRRLDIEKGRRVEGQQVPGQTGMWTRFAEDPGLEIAARMMMGFGATQSRTSPLQGMSMVAAIMEQVMRGERAGVKVDLGLRNTKNQLMRMFKGWDQNLADEGVGMKLYDFLDSIVGNKKRTVDPDGIYEPAAMDVHMLRAYGFYDREWLNLTAKQMSLRHGVTIDAAKADLLKGMGLESEEQLAKSLPGDAYQYHQALVHHQSVVDLARDTQWLGKEWTDSRQVQAVIWFAQQKAMGNDVRDLGSTFRHGALDVSWEVKPSAGATIGSLMPSWNDMLDEHGAEAMRHVTKTVADGMVPLIEGLTGVRIIERPIYGYGRWRSNEGVSVAPNTGWTMFGSTEQLQDAMDVLGYLTQQDEIFATRIARPRGGKTPTTANSKVGRHWALDWGPLQRWAQMDPDVMEALGDYMMMSHGDELYGHMSARDLEGNVLLRSVWMPGGNPDISDFLEGMPQTKEWNVEEELRLGTWWKRTKLAEAPERTRLSENQRVPIIERRQIVEVQQSQNRPSFEIGTGATEVKDVVSAMEGRPATRIPKTPAYKDGAPKTERSRYMSPEGEIVERLSMPVMNMQEVHPGQSVHWLEEQGLLTGRGGFWTGKPKRVRYLYRTISEEDWQQIQRTGSMKSDQRMNLSQDEGTVADFEPSSFYLPGRLASNTAGDYGGRIVRIRYDPDDAWYIDPRDGYVKTNNAIPISRFDKVSERITTRVYDRPNDPGHTDYEAFVEPSDEWGDASTFERQRIIAENRRDVLPEEAHAQELGRFYLERLRGRGRGDLADRLVGRAPDGGLMDAGRRHEAQGLVEAAYADLDPTLSDRVIGGGLLGEYWGDDDWGTVRHQRSPKGVRGAVAYTGAEAATLYALKDADASTGIHEMFHVFAREMDPSGRAVIVKAYNEAKGLSPRASKAWRETVEEWAAAQFEEYVAGGANTAPLPAMAPLFNEYGSWARTTLQRSPYPVDPRVMGVFDSFFDAAEGKPAATYDVDAQRWINVIRDAYARAEEQAHTDHYYKRGRSWTERSVNHPYLGMYPASYMWGKVLPNMLRFLVRKPFGIEAPLAGLQLAKHTAFYAQLWLQTDPNVASFIEDNPQAIRFLQLLLPGTPWEIPVNAPAWARHLAEDELQNQWREANGLERQRTDVGRVASDTLNYAFSIGRNIEQPFDILSELGTDINALGQSLGLAPSTPPEAAPTLPDPAAIWSQLR